MKASSRILAATALGGLAACIWRQVYRGNAKPPYRELSRWEDEGGSVGAAGGDDMPPASPHATHPAGSAGPAEAGGQTPESWSFPRNH
jgi:hypothetical protein